MFSKTLRTSLIALASSALIVSAEKSLSLSVAGPESVNAVDKLQVLTTITNTGDEKVKVLNDPYGPLSPLPTDTFTITNASGAKPAFTGIKAKYLPAVAVLLGAYTELGPGQSTGVLHNLFAAYNFTRTGEGLYNIQANNRFFIVNDDASVEVLYAHRPSSHLSRISGKLASTRPVLSKRAKFDGCSTSQSTDLDTAAVEAHNYAAGALSYASALTNSTSRYATWFGTFAASGLNTITTHYSNINGNTFSNFTYDCSCTESGTFAYVYPDEFGHIYLCGAFWRAPMVGTDSKAGTLIHESSHFEVNGGTDDYVYGQSRCKALAISNPSRALMNADSHEYFAENTPVLS